MPTPDFNELLDRIDALEQRRLKLSDLPFGPLKDRLETDWTPNAGLLLGVKSITLAMLDGIERGDDSLVWPGGSPESNVLTVPHTIGRLPNVQVTAKSRAGAAAIAIWTGSITDHDFQVRARTLDGTSPAAAATADFDWRAEG